MIKLVTKKQKNKYNIHKEESMGEFIINSILWTLALYGLFEIIKKNGKG